MNAGRRIQAVNRGGSLTVYAKPKSETMRQSSHAQVAEVAHRTFGVVQTALPFRLTQWVRSLRGEHSEIGKEVCFIGYSSSILPEKRDVDRHGRVDDWQEAATDTPVQESARWFIRLKSKPRSGPDSPIQSEPSPFGPSTSRVENFRRSLMRHRSRTRQTTPKRHSVSGAQRVDLPCRGS